MTKPNRILIAYDGSAHADAILTDLARAGLADQMTALVLSVAERWLPRIGLGERSAETGPGFENALALASAAAAELKSRFPYWSVSSEAAAGSPARVIVRRAQEWGADLLAVGSLGRTAIEKLLLGSVSHKAASEAHCSVRVARPVGPAPGGGVGIVLAYDGLPGSELALHAVASRHWPQGAQVRLLTCVGFGYSPVSQLTLAEDYDRAREIQIPPERTLREAGLHVSPVIREDDPKHAIVEAAAELNAHCVFIGCNDEPPLTRLLLGTVSSAVVTRAPCSIEIVR